MDATINKKVSGTIPADSLFLRFGEVEEAARLVATFHYSHRWPANVQLVGTFHAGGGLFGDCGEAVAACIFSIPPTRWGEPVIELSRLVRSGQKVPLTSLISACIKRLRKSDFDLAVSFADKTHGHEGIVYRAANWRWNGCREPRMDGLIIDGSFVPGRSSNSAWGTRSPSKLQKIMPLADIEAHWDEGKHLYWYPIRPSGQDRANRLGLESTTWKKDRPGLDPNAETGPNQQGTDAPQTVNPRSASPQRGGSRTQGREPMTPSLSGFATRSMESRQLLG